MKKAGEIEKNLAKLIQYRTVSGDHYQNRLALSWVKRQVADLPLFVRNYSSNKFPSLVLQTQKTKTPKLWLAGHIDVVSGKKSQFKLRKRNYRYYGRGVFDMKFAIACYVNLLRDLGKQLTKLNLGVMLTSDEELGGFNGTAHVLSKGYGGDLVFLPDGASHWQFEQAQKGICFLLVETFGKAAHGSRPWRGKNALEELVGFLSDLKSRFPEDDNHSDDHFHNTINISRLHGGEAFNQVPDYASAIVDIRFVPNTSKKKLRNIIDDVKQNFERIKITEIVCAEGVKSDLNSRPFRFVRDLTKDKLKIKMGSEISHGSSDAHFFAEKNIEVMTMRPRGGGQHARDEWMNSRDLERFYTVLRDFVLEFGK